MDRYSPEQLYDVVSKVENYKVGDVRPLFEAAVLSNAHLATGVAKSCTAACRTLCRGASDQQYCRGVMIATWRLS